MEKLQITLILGALAYLFIIFWMLKKNKNENKKFSGLEIVLTVIMFLIGNKKKS